MTDFIPLCTLADIPEGGSKGFALADRKLFAVKQRGKVFVYHNVCPHLGVELEWVADQFLDSSGSLIQCANHGALFVVENGRCVSGPCVGKTLQAVQYEVQDGVIYIRS